MNSLLIYATEVEEFEGLLDIVGMNMTQTIIALLIIFLPIILALMIAKSTNFLFGFSWYLLLICAFVYITTEVLNVKEPSIGFLYGVFVLAGEISPIEILKSNLKISGEIFYEGWFNTAASGALMLILSIPTAIINSIRKKRRY